MKRFAFRLLLSITTFAAGLGATAIWHLYSPPPLEVITSLRDDYAGRPVRFRAILDLNEMDMGAGSPGGTRFYVMSSCERRECAAFVQFDEDVRTAGLQPYHLKAARGGERVPQKVRFADVAIEGTMVPAVGPTRCVALGNDFNHARVERVYKTYEFESDEAATAWLIKNRGCTQ